MKCNKPRYKIGSQDEPKGSQQVHFSAIIYLGYSWNGNTNQILDSFDKSPRISALHPFGKPPKNKYPGSSKALLLRPASLIPLCRICSPSWGVRSKSTS